MIWIKRVTAGVLVCGLLSFVSLEAHAQQKPDAHAGHNHEKHHQHAGAINHDLGTTEVAGLKLSVIQELAVEPGKETAIEVSLASGQKAPKAVRAWYGTASAEGSIKAKAKELDPGHYDCHIEVPKSIPTGSMLWLEVEPDTGKKAKTSFPAKLKSDG